MDNVIEMTKKLIEVFEGSDLIKNLEHYKSKVLLNDELIHLIKKYETCEDEYEKMALKKEIYKYEEYSLYMKYYNELFFYVLKINSRFKSYTDGRRCNT